jgi:hypothetical protein
MLTPFDLNCHKGMLSHIDCIMIRIKMDVFHRVLSAGMTKHMLRNRSSSHLIHMGCGGMTEKMGMQMFVNANVLGDIRFPCFDKKSGPLR